MIKDTNKQTEITNLYLKMLKFKIQMLQKSISFDVASRCSNQKFKPLGEH